ncbi:major facilitator family transporter [Hyphomonas neptunium ATCC 15444]|uniref:Major facilitator family transporter n=2 Tax=Hyphomonas TaxID=85 RepID=Q0C024_HYPNA|nr:MULTISPECIES: MFS transporter [Hyphomonas]ABI77543.1 major facilitator family transporter [Hyphomonas neptunium ATCC 15444]KCZ86607.1 major facilitator family transporter [Hyphomonas hirschiana VP5]
MTETAAPSTRHAPHLPRELAFDADDYASGWRIAAILIALFLINVFAQIDRILPFILAEAIKTDLDLSDTQIGLLTGLAFAVCYTLLSLPLARLSDRGSPRFVLIGCTLVWSAMTALGGLAAGFVFLALTRFGVAVGEAGAVPSAHALIARKIRPGLRGLAIGIFSMGIPLGTMAGFAIGGAMADTMGWRAALMGAGLFGALIALLALFVLGPTPPLKQAAAHSEPFLKASLNLLAAPAFRWLFIAAIFAGFAAAPFYAFTAPFLIRTHGLTASEAGLAFGSLQGLMGILGTLAGGRWFDHAVRSGTGRVLGPPGVLFLIASVPMAAALFAPVSWLSIALMVPGMLAFAFLLPWSFGAAHLVAGRGKEAMASSLAMIGSGLLGPALGPLIVGLISDTATAAEVSNGLGIGMLIIPLACILTGCSILVANRQIAATIMKN